jgi:acyl transferase domain-containing protein/NAD(P)H-dependent flavin oxidoreductase YrpB (nitropropane dioxygenase family)/NAD(P)-dependent dehydrogenase (short-subunit alcohol dehydrogenase family)
MFSFSVIGLTLPRLPDPAVAIAVSRAGGIGVLDLQWGDGDPDGSAPPGTQTQPIPALFGHLERLRGLCKGRWGLKFDGQDETLVRHLIARLDHCEGARKAPARADREPNDTFELVILTDAPRATLKRQIARLRSAALAPKYVLLEIAKVDAKGRVSNLDLDGINGYVAKGEEAGGIVGVETSFILLQRLLKLTSRPIWVHGGVGLHSAAAVRAAGAAGVVLDAQFCLADESTLPEAARGFIARADGSETATFGRRLGLNVHLCNHFNSPAIKRLKALEEEIGAQDQPGFSTSERLSRWKAEVAARIGWGDTDRWLWPLGQDCGKAAGLASRFNTVGGIVSAIMASSRGHIEAARAQHALAEGSSLARSHATRYPIVQGPMTRVSDSAAFAAEVATAGGLPMIALALSDAAQTRRLLVETRTALDGRAWGIGILGFVPLPVRNAQLEVIKELRPNFALIAGGRPDQAVQLENLGIATYLHTPSAALLTVYFEQGTRRFVFEGRECGGHIGPRTSFVLWDAMTEALLALHERGASLEDVHVLFAGGIHDAVSASMVAALSAPLVEAGVKIGVLLGTAYLFTREAVATGAIVPGFQAAAIGCDATAVLESGAGHASRCAPSPFVDFFDGERRRLKAAGSAGDHIRDGLEELCLGRLRTATRGLTRHRLNGAEPALPDLVVVDRKTQWTDGMYMIGQMAALRRETTSIAELHRDVCFDGPRRLNREDGPSVLTPKAHPCDVAIIGISTLLPGATDVRRFWENILGKVDVITEIPPGRFDWRQYYDPDPDAPDKIYSKWGGFLDDVPFDPVRYGIPPNALSSIEPMQLLTLEAVRAAIEDAGYKDRPFARSRTSVILGAGGGLADLGQQYGIRSGLPTLLNEFGQIGQVPGILLDKLPSWTEDSFPGLLLNVVAGRISNRFDLGGVNCTVDAACASSLAAIYVAAHELCSRSSDVVIVGGVDTVQNPFAYLCFSKTKALSPRGRCRPFDAGADGIAISEGLVIFVMKRLADAERDGDRVYAVLKSIAGSSDGRVKGLTAPCADGQVAALLRAYELAGISPETVGLIEAHGTGTVAGDSAEVEALKRVYPPSPSQHCAVGSVKSMIGHTKCAAGAAGLAKAALALHEKVLPPTINVEAPNPKANFANSPFFVNTELRPWLPLVDGTPRRAGVSAFGFGGTNFHAVLEEYLGDPIAERRRPLARRWPSELLTWSEQSASALRAEIFNLCQAIDNGAQPDLADLGSSLWQEAMRAAEATPAGVVSLAIIAGSLSDLRAKLATVEAHLAAAHPNDLLDRGGIYLKTQSAQPESAKVAFLFPGQGSQHPGMLRELAVYFREIREAFETADRVLASRIPERLSTYVFPPPTFNDIDLKRCQKALSRTEITQPAMGAACLGMLHLLHSVGLNADLLAGHSYGEYVALAAAGMLSDESLYAVSEARGRSLMNAASAAEDGSGSAELGTMLAAFDDAERVAKTICGVEGVWIANINSPRQTMLSGTSDGVAAAARLLAAAGIEISAIPVGCGFHSPLMERAQPRLAEVLATTSFLPRRIPVFSNTTAQPYPEAPGAAASLLVEHLVLPVRFSDEIEAMYAHGVRTFIEVGPKSVLTGLVGHILTRREHLAVATCGDTSSLTQFQHALARLFVHRIPLSLGRLFEGRANRRELPALLEAAQPLVHPSGTWLVNGSGVRRAGDPPVPVKPAVKQPAGPAPKRAAAITRPLAAPATPPEAGARRGAPAAGIDQVIIGFQTTMTHFLEAQRETMLSYLRTRERVGVATSEVGLGIEVPTEAAARQTAAKPQATEPVATRPTGDPRVDPPMAVPTAERPAVFDQLVNIVSERTGYPADMLKPALDLEAELGIDSIKRVEILGAFRRACSVGDQGKLQSVMEHLTSIKTLGSLAESLGTILSAGNPSQRAPPASALQPSAAAPRGLGPTPLPDAFLSAATVAITSAEASATAVRLPRYLLAPVDIPAPVSRTALPGGAIIITDDGTGVATELAQQLRKLCATVALIQTPDIYGGDRGDGVARPFCADLGDPEEMERTVNEIRRIHGQVAMVLHLHPLGISDPPSFADLPFWRQRIGSEVKGLFNLARSAGSDLRSHGEPRATLLAATCLGGDFGIDKAECGVPFPTHGGVAGLIKSIAHEWPSVRCRVIDFKAGFSPKSAARHLIAEATADCVDDLVEIGYQGTRRLKLRLAPSPLSDGVSLRAPVGRDAVVLVTGGARGITAQAALALAARRPCRLILVARSELPSDKEMEATAGLASAVDIRRVLIDRMRHADVLPAPAAIEAECIRILRDREIRSNLQALRETGSDVQYRQCDLADDKAFAGLIDEVYATYGRIDGVIHGAGIIEDRLVEHKDARSFDRVISAKVDGALLLAAKLRPESLKFLALFSSIAARFGNRGQADYAAANEVLNKLAAHLDTRWPTTRVVALNWGPWDGSNMVTAAVRDQFVRQAVELIAPADGCAAFIEELIGGSKGHAEVVLGGGPWGEQRAGAAPTARSAIAPPVAQSEVALPLLGDNQVSISLDGAMSVTLPMDPIRHLYLNDHRIDGRPVLPAAMAVELFAELVQRARPDRIVSGVRSLRVNRGVILHQSSAKTLRVVGRPPAADGNASLTVDVEIRDDDHDGVICFVGRVCLGERRDESRARSYVEEPLGQLFPFPDTVKGAYCDRLFHGPMFHVINRISGLNQNGIQAVVRASRPEDCLAAAQSTIWIVDPILLDAGPQLAILWAQAMWGVTPLPTRFGYVRIFDGLAEVSKSGRLEPLTCRLVIDPSSEDPTLVADYELFDHNGRLLLSIERLEATGSRALNRLASPRL